MASFFADELHALGCQLFDQLQKVTGIAGKTTDRLHDHCITPADIFHHLLQLGAVGVFAAHAVDVDLVHAQLLHQQLLPGGILVNSGYADVTDFQWRRSFLL